MISVQKISKFIEKSVFTKKKPHISCDTELLGFLSLASFQSASESAVLFICPSSSDAEQIYNEAMSWKQLLKLDIAVHLLPELESKKKQFLPEFEGERARILDLTSSPGIFISSIRATLQPTAPPDSFRNSELRLKKGNSDWPPQKLAKFLTELDYDNEIEVHLPGEFSWRGGILDVFCPVYDDPLRIEYWDDEIDNMRFFSTENQRSLSETEDYRIIPRGEVKLTRTDDYYCFIDYFSSQSLNIFLCNQMDIAEHLDAFDKDYIKRYEEICDGRYNLKITGDLHEHVDAAAPASFFSLDALYQAARPEIDDGMERLQNRFFGDSVKRWMADGYDVLITAGSESKLSRCEDILKELDCPIPQMMIADIGYGLIIPDAQVVVISETEVFGKKRLNKRHKKHTYHSDYMAGSGHELIAGEYAVHAAHGICKFKGIRLESFNHQLQELMILEFRDDLELQVPLSQAYLINRYVGSSKKLPQLSKVGGKNWKGAIEKAEFAIKDLAAELLRMQALRKTCETEATTGEDSMMQSFADAFPYNETSDQQTAIDEVLADLAISRPMDRLLCGDVGFGKTEVAMRAAFQTVLSGKQVAILVPTTILCQQHLISFQERFKEFPVIIESMSRFRSRKEQNQTLKNMEEGKVDIVIGTHRLISDDIKFSNLGLLIIDEEQRFGVMHKEKLKQMRVNVDVLSMSATPVPRTLYLSMAGLRDLSTIATAPLERLPVQTIISQYDEELIREAIMRELQRDGQTFFLHNRVQTIHKVAETLRKLIPEARFDVGHGQMDERELEAVMLRFLEGKTDVLISTTIIESGLDIQNANTIIIDRADRFGLADLYQLRGRVGRYHRQAYAYMLIPSYGALIRSARDRLSAIRKYTQLGSGFKLAMRDLEIRGTGNILGKEQSGHISAIGFDLYCQLLKEAVSRLSGDERPVRVDVSMIIDFLCLGDIDDDSQVSACIPVSFISEEKTRVEMYKKLSTTKTDKELKAFKEELIDRFGKLPEQIENLLNYHRLKYYASRANVHSIKNRDKRILLEGKSGILKVGGQVPELTSKTAKNKFLELIKIVKDLKR
ncbi:MAG: transcription-repair coupling factor [Lentisphaeria bacterium]|nr:transcription-repair coupling factor [Lentisphaeria bacterium]NQZ69333.1 transcription-repair coupling factor [Lentisphaeria bacterium]